MLLSLLLSLAAATEPTLQVIVFDMGQADATLVVGPAPEHRTLLIDLGHWTRRSKKPPHAKQGKANHDVVAERLVELTGRRHVDWFVATHFHTDHVGTAKTGLSGLLQAGVTVSTLIHPGNVESAAMGEKRRTKDAFIKRIQQAQGAGIGQILPPIFGDGLIQLGGDTSVTIEASGGRCSPDDPGALEAARLAGADYAKAPASENDLSIALTVRAGEFELFTAGDLTGGSADQPQPEYLERRFEHGDRVNFATYTHVERHLTQCWARRSEVHDVEVYRANHHGSAHSSSPELLAALDPEHILYSTGGDHDHPDPDTLARGGETARQLATTWVNDLGALTSNRGQRVGEIHISVQVDDEGTRYSIGDRTWRAWTDAEEAAGDDVGAEDRPL